MGNVLGEPFKEYVSKQISTRQDIHGSARRGTQELQYLNSRNAWIKLASGASFKRERLDLLGTNPLVVGVEEGNALSRQNVLFNGLGKNEGKTKISKKTVSNRSGVRGNEQNIAYGVGGTQEYGYSPMPGIVSADIKDLNRGSIKKATLSIKAHNKAQFDVIDVVYLRLGFSVMLEWGNDKYIKNYDGYNTKLDQMGATLIDKEFFDYKETTYKSVLPRIERYREKYCGNYDGMFGVVSNFSWSFNNDGSYDIKLEIISHGDIIESLKINLPPVQNTKKSEEADNNSATQNSNSDLQNLINEEIANRETFYDDLYPGLREIIGEWYKTSTKLTAKGLPSNYPQFNTLTNNVESDKGLRINWQFGDNFPNLKPFLLKYKNDKSTYPDIKNEQNIENVEDLDSDFDNIVMLALNMREAQQNANNNKTYEYLEFNSPAPTTTNIYNFPNANVFTHVRGSYPDSTWNTRYDAYLAFLSYSGMDYFLEDQYVKYADALEISLSDLDDDQKTVLERRIILINTGLELILDAIFQYFKEENKAGGTEDEQFDSLRNPEASDEGEEPSKEEQESELKETLEDKRQKNKVFQWFYDIRYCWDRNKDNQDILHKFFKNEGFQDITIPGSVVGAENIVIGNCINPIVSGTDNSTPPPKVKMWNEGVGFPIYPRPSHLNDGTHTKPLSPSLQLAKLKENKGNLGDINSLQPNSIDIARFNFDVGNQYYIRLGLFLEFIEKQVIPKITDSKSSNKNGEPMLNIDYHPETNICYAIDNMISVDSSKLIIKNQFFTNGNTTQKIYPELKDFMHKPYGGASQDNNYYYGNIMNVYFSFARIEEFFDDDSNKNSDGSINAYDLFRFIADDLNESLGGVNNIEPIVDKETNTLKFIDQTHIPGINQIVNYLKTVKYCSNFFEVNLNLFNILKKYPTDKEFKMSKNNLINSIFETSFELNEYIKTYNSTELNNLSANTAIKYITKTNDRI